MKTVFRIVIISLLLNSCSQTGEPIFDFDKVTHYYIDADSLEFKLLVSREEKPITDEDKILLALFHDTYPDNLNDDKFWNFIKTSNRIKGKIIKSSYYPDLQQKVFVHTGVERTEEKACIAEYRDIFVFEKNSEVTGVAKICFHCSQFIFIPDTWDYTFGASGEFKALREILKQNNGQ